ncbi:MAG: iron-sulfur cluster assembly protein, partial [Xanthobacteraceae bacterium]
MSVTERQIRDVLSNVMSPDGVPLTQAKVLSEIAINDGKAYFSINVDAANAAAWGDVRAKAEAAVRGMPGVTSAMVVLTAERKPMAAAG